MLRSYLMIVARGELGQPRFLRWHIAPFLHNWLLHLPWVGSCPCTDLLGNINTLLSRSKFGHQLGHVLAGTLGLQRTLFLGGILDHCLLLVKTLLGSFLEATTSRSTEFSWLLSTTCDRSELLHSLLGHRTHFLGPLGTLCICCVARCFIFTLLLHHSLTCNNIIINIMNLLLGPTL